MAQDFSDESNSGKSWCSIAACVHPCLLGLCLGSARPCEAFVLTWKGVWGVRFRNMLCALAYAAAIYTLCTNFWLQLSRHIW